MTKHEELGSRPRHGAAKPCSAPLTSKSRRTLTDAETLRWKPYIDNRISAAFEARAWRDDARRDAIGDALGEIRKQLRAEILTAVGELRADIEVATKAADLRARGDVVELPNFIGRRHGAA
jgi:hypothetical protein